MELYKFNNLDGKWGFGWGKKYNEIYDVLDTMRDKKNKDDFDYKCDPSGNDPSRNYVNLTCEEAKMLKYILQFNLKRNSPKLFINNNNIDLLSLKTDITIYKNLFDEIIICINQQHKNNLKSLLLIIANFYENYKIFRLNNFDFDFNFDKLFDYIDTTNDIK